MGTVSCVETAGVCHYLFASLSLLAEIAAKMPLVFSELSSIWLDLNYEAIMFFVMPKRISQNQVQAKELDTFPLCFELDFSTPGTDDFVLCPMVGQKHITEGCCMDTQAAALSSDFSAHPYYDIFQKSSVALETDIDVLRKTCLRHQAAILQDRLTDIASAQLTEQTEKYFERINRILEE